MIKNDWLTTEIALLRERYASTPSHAELMALFPRHTPNSVHRMARLEGLSRPRAGVVKFRPGRERLMKLLEQEGPLTAKRIGERLGICHGAVENLKRAYRIDLRIAGWEPPPRAGKWAPKWGIANGLPDAFPPFLPKDAKVGRKMANPFATAAGLVQPILTASTGRIFQQPMDVEDWGQSQREAA